MLRVAQRGTGPWLQGMLVKFMYSLQAGDLEEFEMLLGIVGETSPAPDAASTWALSIATGVFMPDRIGRLHGVAHYLQALSAVARDGRARQPIASTIFHAIVAARTAYAEEDPMKALEHGEAIAPVHGDRSQTLHRDLEELHWHEPLVSRSLAGTDQLITEATVSDHESGAASSYRPFVLAWMLADRGSLDEARRWASRLVEAGRIRHLPVDEGRGHWALAEVLRRAGELEAADAEIQAALALLRRAAPLDVPGALATLAALRLAQGRIPEALAATAEGLERYEAMGACGFFRGAFLRLTHARCLDAAGDHDAARAAITAARARLFAIADKIGDPEYRRSFLEVVPENRQTLELAHQWLGPAPVAPS